MVDFSTREGIMKEWDSWVRYYRSGGGGTWPADAFESLLDYFDEQRQLSSSSSRVADRCAFRVSCAEFKVGCAKACLRYRLPPV